MSRTERKCLLASAAGHGLLTVLLFLAPAFAVSTQKPPTELRMLTFIPATAVDQLVVSGGNPEIAPEPPPVAPVIQQPEPAKPQPTPADPPPVTPPRVEPVRPEPVKLPEKIEPAREAPKPVEKPRDTRPEPVKTPPPKRETPKVIPTFTPSRGATVARNPQAEARAAEQARQQAQREQARRWDQAAAGLSRLSSSTSIEMPGPGGAAFAHYGSIVRQMYMDAWIKPAEIDADSAVVATTVVIARDGRVVSARITRPSGIRAVDDSVRRALELKFIKPFPEGATDLERTFHLKFDLTAKRSL